MAAMNALQIDSATRFGRLHPVVLHFPIVCLVLALVFEWAALLRRQPAFGGAARTLLAVGILTGVVAILSGLQFAEESTFEGERAPLYERHKLLAFVAAGAAVAAFLLGIIYRRAPSRGKRAVYFLLVHVAAVSVAVGAHAGALLHW